MPLRLRGDIDNLTGKKFHYLRALMFTRMNVFREAMWLWRCDCGSTKEIRAARVKRGDIKSCGCGIARSRTHDKPAQLSKTSDTLGTLIYDRRRERHITRYQLAEKMRISTSAIHRWENNEGLPTLAHWISLCIILGIERTAIFDLAGSSNRKDWFVDEQGNLARRIQAGRG